MSGTLVARRVGEEPGPVFVHFSPDRIVRRFGCMLEVRTARESMRTIQRNSMPTALPRMA